MATITEDFVSFETAKLLKEKNCPDFGYSCICDSEGNKAQTQSIIMKWLREVHNVNIEIHYNRFGKNYKYLIIYKPEVLDDIRSLGVYYRYEEACEAAIKYCLENLI